MLKPIRLSAVTISLGYIAVSLVAVLLFAIPILYAWHEIVEERNAERLREDANRLSNVLQHHGSDALKAVIEAMTESQPAGDEKFILFADTKLVPIAGNLPVWPQTMPAAPGTYFISFDRGGQQVHAILIRIALSNGDSLLVGRNTAKFQTVETLFWVGLLGSASTVLVFGFIGGLLIRRALLGELHGIRQTTEAIIAGDLSRRLPRSGEANELDMLAQTVNRMLDQIESLVHGILNVSNAIAHDLRTPLTEIRSMLEELIRARPPMDETIAIIDTVMGDVDRVIAIFNALLRLAEIDNGARRSGFKSVNVTQVASDAVEFYQPLAELKEIALSFQPADEHIVGGDPLLLAQAIGNLIDNALKFAQRKVVVTIATTTATAGQDTAVAVTVSDDGPGIPDTEKPKVVERFYRGDASRGTPGAGLGLSLVASVAKLHGGALTFADAHPGLRASLQVSNTSGTSD